MSYALKEIVKRTQVKPMAAKALMLHVADMVRENGGWEFWESHGTTAKHLGTDRKTVRRHLAALEDLGVVFCQTRREIKGGYVNVFLVDVPRLLALPCVDETETRGEFVKRLIEGEKYCHEANWPDETAPQSPSDGPDKGGADNPHPRGSQPHPPGLTTPTPGADNPTNGNKPHLTLIIGKRADDPSDQSLSRDEKAERDAFNRNLDEIREGLTSTPSQRQEAGL